ncbi:YfhO family protein [Butyrivibrio sp. FC2001]|uniref:YfhO family protein n=1 Tax=Butyrivibrio sp. FC2001 TaxID=1280671 RepID=UPI0004075806|nr:YfhO family protein [Butyrivibrio sp. FC2001]
MKSSSAGSRRKAFICFTLIYIVISVLVWGWFFKSGKSLINSSDAFKQHINALAKYGRFIRGIFYRLFTEHKLSLQSYDFGIGYGADFYTSMQYYAVGDPLNLPAGLLPSKYIYYYFQFLIFLRPYLAGLAFLLLTGRKERFALTARLTGALSYSFCGIVLFIGMWNPQFVQPMICLPLLIYGVQKYIDEKRSLPFILAVAFSAVSNFYFFYMLVLMIIVYTVIYIITEKTAKDFKEGITVIGSFLGFGVVGTLIAMPILLPVVLSFLSNPRAGLGSHAVPVIYSLDYYKELLCSMISYKYFPRYDTVISLTFIALPALALLFLKADENKKGEVVRYRIIAIIMTAMLLIPVAGYVMTGFSYTINRWSFAYCLLLSYLITYFAEEIVLQDLKNIFIAGIISVVYVGILILFGEKSPNIYPQLLLLAVMFALLFVVKLPVTVRRGGVLLLVIIGIVINGYVANAPDKGNLPSGYVDKMSPEEYDDLVMNTELKALAETVPEGADNYYSYSGRSLTWNASLPYGIPSTQFYWSLANGAVSDFMESLAVNEMSNFSFFGLDDRTIPMELAGVKYYTLRYNNEEEQRYIPYGYAPFSEWYNFGIFANTYAPALGYTYRQTMSREDYDALDPVKRQQAMLYGAVREKENSDVAVELSELDTASEGLFTETSVSFEVTDKHKVKIKDGAFVAKKDGAECTLSFEGIPGSETYLYFENLNCDIKEDAANITVSTDTPENGAVTKTIAYKTPYSQFYSGWHNYLVNLCYSSEARSRITITFPQKGTYSFDSLQVICQPMDTYAEKAQALAAETMTDNNLHRNPKSLMTNEITGTITAAEDSYLVLNVPYDKGWTIYVDGEKRTPEKANIMFLGTPIGAGTHSIEMRYHTPGVVPGIILFILGIAGAVVLNNMERKEKCEIRKRH